MEGDAEKEARHPTVNCKGKLTFLSLKIFTVVGVSFVLRPEESDGT